MDMDMEMEENCASCLNLVHETLARCWRRFELFALLCFPSSLPTCRKKDDVFWSPVLREFTFSYPSLTRRVLTCRQCPLPHIEL